MLPVRGWGETGGALATPECSGTTTTKWRHPRVRRPTPSPSRGEVGDELDPLVKRLHLANSRRLWRDRCRRAEVERWSSERNLTALAAEENTQRSNTRVARLTRKTQAPFITGVDGLTVTFRSMLRLQVMSSFLSPELVSEGRNLILSDKPGMGKTHLASAFAYQAIQNGLDAFFPTCAALIDGLSGVASHKGRVRYVLAQHAHPDVLVIDEVADLTAGNDAANVHLHVLNDRHSKGLPIIFTKNKNQKTWCRVLHDDDLAEVIVDRLLERGRHLGWTGRRSARSRTSTRTRRRREAELQPRFPGRSRRSLRNPQVSAPCGTWRAMAHTRHAIGYEGRRISHLHLVVPDGVTVQRRVYGQYLARSLTTGKAATACAKRSSTCCAARTVRRSWCSPSAPRSAATS